MVRGQPVSKRVGLVVGSAVLGGRGSSRIRGWGKCQAPSERRGHKKKRGKVARGTGK